MRSTCASNTVSLPCCFFKLCSFKPRPCHWRCHISLVYGGIIDSALPSRASSSARSFERRVFTCVHADKGSGQVESVTMVPLFENVGTVSKLQRGAKSSHATCNNTIPKAARKAAYLACSALGVRKCSLSIIGRPQIMGSYFN